MSADRAPAAESRRQARLGAGQPPVRDPPPPSSLGGALIVHYRERAKQASVCRSPPSSLGGSSDWSAGPTVTESFAPPSKLGGGGRRRVVRS